MTGDNNQLNNNDPLAEFTPQAQAEPTAKVTFAGQEFNSLEEAQRWSAERWEQQEREKQQLAAQLQAMQTQRQPPQQQYVTGRESATYDHSQWLRKFGEDPTAIDQLLKYRLFGDPNAKEDPIELMKAGWMQTARMQQQMEALRLQAAHPEIPWNDQRALQMIENAKQVSGGSYEGAIAILQRDGHLPTRVQWQAQVSQPVTQQNTAAQTGTFQSNGATNPAAPPMVGRTQGAPQSMGIDEDAFLRKLNDPNTSIEEGERMIQAFQARLAQNPSAGGL